MNIFSKLQRYILLSALSQKKLLTREEIRGFYGDYKIKSKTKDAEDAITKSIDRLISRGFIIGFGYKTSRKWYNKSVKLTSLGKKSTRELLGKQLTLPFKKIK